MKHPMKMTLAALLIGGFLATPTLDAQRAERSATFMPMPLHLEINGHEFFVSGGQLGDFCGIAVGFRTAAIPLPNGSMILIDPVAIVAMGHFDGNGEFRVILGYDGKMLAPIQYHFQAFAIEGDSLNLVTSDRVTLDFRYPGGNCDQDGVCRDDGTGQDGTRCGPDGVCRVVDDTGQGGTTCGPDGVCRDDDGTRQDDTACGDPTRGEDPADCHARCVAQGKCAADGDVVVVGPAGGRR